MAIWVGAQGQVTSAIKLRKHATIIMSPTENPKAKAKKIFLSKL